jgi:peroxiredoxin
MPMAIWPITSVGDEYRAKDRLGDQAVWLQRRLDTLKAAFEGGDAPWSMPKIVGERLARSNAELASTGVGLRALKIDDFAPDFRLEDTRGLLMSSETIRMNGPMVVVFYRGVWCPYCSMELQALQDFLPDIQRWGGQLVAISPQLGESSRRAQIENKLTFPVLIDPGNKTAEAFGVRWKQQDYLIDLHKTVFGADLTEINGDDSWTLPMPSRFVIGIDGRVFHADVSIDHTRRPDPEDLLPALRAATSAARRLHRGD